jgi:NitT/TauT family transport system ATP-binding protein
LPGCFGPITGYLVAATAERCATMGGTGLVAAAAARDAADRPAVQYENVSIAFAERGGGRYEAVGPTDLVIAPGEFVAIVGPTGCGKSTLLNVAAGLLTPSTGICRSLGTPVAGVNRSAGYLFQLDALMPWKTAVDNVAVGLEVTGTRRPEALARAKDWLGRVGLAAFAGRYPHQLSGGQRKRVGLAQVLIRDPKLLLMDEPFGPLDAQTRALMGELLLDLWSADRKAVLFVTHDLEEAIALADRVLIMSAGPSSRVIGDYRVPLSRPRDVEGVRVDPVFTDLRGRIWEQLKGEVLAAYSRADHG